MKIGYKLGIILLWIVFCSLASAQQVMNPQFSATRNISFSIKDDRGIVITNATVVFEPIYQGTPYQFPASHQESGKYQVDLPTNVAIDGTFRMTITEAKHETYSQNINIHTDNNFTVVILYNDYYEQYSVGRDQLIEQFDLLTATIDLTPYQTPQGTISTAPRSREETFIIPFPLSAAQFEKAAFARMLKPFITRTDIYYELIKEIVLQTAIKELGPLDMTISAWLDYKYQHALSLPQPGDVMETMKEFAGFIGAPLNSLGITTVKTFSNIIYDAAKASNEGLYKAALLAFSYHLYQQQCIDLFIQKNKVTFGSFDPALQEAILKTKNDIERERNEQLEKIVNSYHNKQLTGAVMASVSKEVAALIPGALCSIAGISLSAGPQVVLFLITKFTKDVIEGSIRSRDLQLRMILLAQLEKYGLSGYGHQYSPDIISRLHSHPDVYYGTLMRIYSGYLYHTMRNKLYSGAPNMTTKIIDAIHSTPFTRQIADVSEHKSIDFAGEYFKLYYDFLRKQQPPKTPDPRRTVRITIGLMLDSSGSMRENDPRDIRKTASELIVNQLSNKETNIFLVDFDDASKWLNENNWQNWNKAELINNIRSIDSQGGTDIGGGLNRMRQALENRIVLGENVGVLLLTDGIGDYQNEAEWFAQNKIRVSTISFVGNDNSGLLQGIAKLTGGDYMKANTPEDIVNTFNEFLTRLMGSNTLCYYQNTINPGQHIQYDFYLDPGVKNVYSSCVWYGSKVGLNFTSPDGIVYAPGNANADWITGDRYIAAKIDNPQPGKWRAEFVGLDIPPGGEPFNFKVNADSPIKIDLVEQGIQGGVVRFALDASQSAGQIKEMTLTISLLTPKNNVMDITNRYRQGRFDFIPSDGKGNYQITINLTGKNKSDHIFQRHFIKTVLIGEYTPLNIAPIKQIIGNYVKAGLGRNVGNRSGVVCYVYLPGGSANNKIARGYVTFVTENECNIEIQQLFGPRQFAVGDIVELDIVNWKNDGR
jgi:hypothetical protein